jgi:hypothetical protein
MNNRRGHEIQQRTLKKLISKAQFTQFGQYYGFSETLDVDDFYQVFKQNVPVVDYIGMLPWWQKARAGEENVCWPGKVKNFALSSGTSDGSTKFIPVTREMLKAIRRASLRQVLSISQSGVKRENMSKKWLMIGGSTQLDYNGVYYSGDLSGITTGKVPILFQRLSKPGKEIRNEKDWKEKIHKITVEAEKWDVGMVAGVPAWIKLLIENILDHYKIDHIHEIWPNLEVYIHGGVSLTPYKKGLDKLMGRPIHFYETYLASEGFIAFQNRPDSNGGMRLIIRNGIFYEFIPFNRENFTPDGMMMPNLQTLRLNEVKENQEYAIILSSCAGAWRYLIGDTVRFTDLDRCEIQITGRTKHFLSLCGEHLSVENMTRAVEIVSREFNVQIPEFTVSGIPHEGFFAHEWFLACDENLSTEEVKLKLDFALRILNDDYRTERLAALKDVFVHLIPLKKFMEYLETIGKSGAQTKFPRVLKPKQLKEFKSFLEVK